MNFNAFKPYLLRPQRPNNDPIYPLTTGYLDPNGWRMAQSVYSNGTRATHRRTLCWTKEKRPCKQEGGLTVEAKQHEIKVTKTEDSRGTLLSALKASL